MMAHLVADGDDAHDDFVAGHRRLVAGDVAGDLVQDFAGQPRDDLGLARVLAELLEQLEIGKTKPHGLDLGQDLVGAGLVDRLGGIQPELAGTDQLHGVLGIGNRAVCGLMGASSNFLKSWRTQPFGHGVRTTSLSIGPQIKGVVKKMAQARASGLDP